MTDALLATLSTMPVALKATGAPEEESKGDGFSRLLDDMKDQTAPPVAQENAVLSPTGGGAVAMPLLFLPTYQAPSENKPDRPAKADAALDQSPGLQSPSLESPRLQSQSLQPPGLQSAGLQSAVLQSPGLQSPGLPPPWASRDPAPPPVQPVDPTDGAPSGERRTASYPGMLAHADAAATPVADRPLEPRRIEAGRQLRDEATFDVATTATSPRASVSDPVDQPRSPLTETGAPEAELVVQPLKIHVSELQTHLPAAIGETLAIRDRSPRDFETVETARLPDRPVEAALRPVKILKFDLEPATLGSISVRMRVTHMRVDIKIDAESASTCALLNETRETLNAAIAQKGLTLESYEVALGASPSPSPPPATSGQGGGRPQDQPPPYSGDRGFANEDRPGQRQKQSAAAHARGPKDVSSVDSAAGVFL